MNVQMVLTRTATRRHQRMTPEKPILGPMAGDDEVTSVLGKNPMPKAHADNGVQEPTLRGTEFSECQEIQFCASVVHIGI